jgi:3-oxo-5-alpha-steroid 4-dehydrogenase 1
MVASAEQIQQHLLLSQLLLLASIPTYLITRYVITAPFGRHVSTSNASPWWYGPKINARISWFLFECPNLFWSWHLCYHRLNGSMLFLDGDESLVVKIRSGEIVVSTNALLVGLFTLHYVNRAIIYPLRMHRSSQPVPLVVILSAVAFTALNGYLQCFYLGHILKLQPLTVSTYGVLNLQALVGILVFFIGMCINIQSDGVLRSLRSQNKGTDATTRRYYIPKGLFYTYISCPNFAGEILEWIGFAIGSNFSLPSVAFVCYTVSNLVPRGIAHHEWYKNKFEDYPFERKWAVIPFIA